VHLNPELSVARACNDLMDAQPDLRDMVMIAFVLEKIAKKFSAADRAGLSAILVRLALEIDKDACSYATQH
jgi:hypothetical protein